MRSFYSIFLIFLVSVFLFGCAETHLQVSKSFIEKQKPLAEMNLIELQDALSHWQRQYEKNPNDKYIGLQFADVLRRVNKNEQSLAVMEQMAIKYPQDQEVLAAYGKALVAGGQLHKALETIERAQTPDNPDWRLLSAKGIILDRFGEIERARLAYKRALELNPNNPSILSNLGMSYLLTGDLELAERHLKYALHQKGAGSQIRQNLSLVLGLRGKYKQAIDILITELPVLDAQQNIQYIRQMITSHNSHENAKVKKQG